MLNLQHILALVMKEFLALLKDKRSRFVLIGPPIIQLLVFGYAATFDLNNVPIAVYNQDNGQAAQELITRFTGSSTFTLVRELGSDTQIKQAIDAREVTAVLVIASDFGRRLARGDGAAVQLIVDGRNSNTALIILGYARTLITDFNTQWVDRHGGSKPPAHLAMRATFNPNLESRWFIVPGIIALLTLVVVVPMLVVLLQQGRQHRLGGKEPAA